MTLSAAYRQYYGLWTVLSCCFVISFFFPAAGRAESKTAISDRVVSSTFKTLAKAYINSSDFNSLKKNTVKRLRDLDQDSFRERYPRVLGIISQSPVLQEKYGFPRDMAVPGAVSIVEGLDKKKACSIIDAVPDGVLAAHVRDYISERFKNNDSRSAIDRVKAAWEDIKKRLDKTGSAG